MSPDSGGGRGRREGEGGREREEGGRGRKGEGFGELGGEGRGTR